MKIKKLRLQNFKAYKDATEFDFEGNNVLIFGTNGSGKSSLYKALKLLFKSSTQELDDVKLYFSRESAETVKNIFTEATVATFIEIETDAPAESDRIHRFEQGKLAKSPIIQEAYLLSEFMTYRLLLNFSQFADSEEANIIKILMREFFPVWIDTELKANYHILEEEEDSVSYKAVADENKRYSYEE